MIQGDFQDPALGKNYHQEKKPSSQSLIVLPANKGITNQQNGWIPMTETRSPLARLVLFMVCLSIAGTVVAGAHYFAVDLPQQKALPAPANDLSPCEKSCAYCYYTSYNPGTCYTNCVKQNCP
jgi:hypothetical protein